MKAKWFTAMVSVIIVLFAAGIVHAITFDFYNITHNSAADAVIGESQFSVDATDPGNNQVLFTFSNTGPNACSIDAVYFQDGPFLGIADIANTHDFVEFIQPVIPRNLAGGRDISPAFIATREFSAGADAPSSTLGINPGETLGILFDLSNGFDFEDVITGLNYFDPANPFRIGIHAQAFADGGSESFVNTTAPVPEPGTMLLLGTGLIGLAGLRKRMAKD